MTKFPMRIGLRIVIAAIAVTAALAWGLQAAGVFAVRGVPAVLVYGLTETGGLRFAPVVLLAVLAAWATDRNVVRSRRRKEPLVALLLMTIALPSAALFNEFVLKPAVAAPRPSHLRLAAVGIIPDMNAFYRLEARERQHWLQARLSETTSAPAIARLDLHPVVLRHWAHETGYTFPSSHALNAFVAAVLFLGGALVVPTPRRRRIAGFMLCWAIAVALSRVLLQVHRPLDVTAGAAAGAVLGALLLLPWRRWSGDRDQKSI